MANIKRNIIFSLENRKKDGVPVVENVPIRMRVIFLNNRVDFSTGYRIDISKWDFEMQKVKNGCTNKLKQTASDINTDLKKYETQIQDIFKAFEIKNIIPTPDLLKQEFNVLNKQKLPDSIKKSKIDFKKALEIVSQQVTKKKEKELKDSFRKKYKPNSIPFMDDKQAEAYLNDFFQLNENINQLYKETTIKLKKVIPVKKVAMIPHTDREFKKELLKKMREKGQAPPPPDEE